EGQWLEWGPWLKCSVTCNTGSQQRQRRCSASVHGWAECNGDHQESRECTNPSCSGGGNWGNWNHWSLCSKTCDSGLQRRFRLCEGTGDQGYPCEGSGEEVRACNEKKCPGSASRRCMLDNNGVAFWGPPSFARCVSLEYRYLHLSKLFQVVSLMLDMGQCGEMGGPPQVAPGAALLMRILEDFIHLIGEAQKPFPSFLVVTNNLMITVQREPVSAVSSDINFPVKGRRGMKDWARTSDDKLYIPKEVFINPAEETETESDAPMYYVIGAILYRTLGTILPAPNAPAVINSKILTVTVRPEPQPSKPMVVLELSPLFNGTSDPQCIVWDYGNPKQVEPCLVKEGWEGKHIDICDICEEYAISDSPCSPQVPPLDQVLRTGSTFELSFSPLFCPSSSIPYHSLQDMGPSSMPSVPLMVGCGVSCTALLILLLIYAAFWRYIRSERSIILVNFCLSILASNLLILVGQSQTLSKGLCTVTAAFLHFFFLASFCWVLTEAWQSYLAVIGKMRSRLIRKRFLCLGWGILGVWVAYSSVMVKKNVLIGLRIASLPALIWDLSPVVTPVATLCASERMQRTWAHLQSTMSPGSSCSSVSGFHQSERLRHSKLVNMLIGIVVFNKLMSRDGISDKSKKQRAGASLWSSCVVLPLLALTWMSAVLAITDRRSTLFQVLFAVFDSVQGFVIITVHCAMRREVQDAVRCRMGGCKDDSENSPDSCKNGQVQIMNCSNVNFSGQQYGSLRIGTPPCLSSCHQQLPPAGHQACQQACYHSLPRSNNQGLEHSHTDFEKDVDLACQTERGHPFIFKEVNTCNPATITGTLSRISLDDDEDPKLAAHQEGVNFSSLPGNIPPPNLIVQVPTLSGLNELSETPLKKDVNLDQQRQHGQQRSGAPIYLCTESGLGWARPPPSSNTSQDGSACSGGSGCGSGVNGGSGEGDYMVLPRRTVSLKPPAPCSQGGGLGDMNIAMNLNRSYGTIKTMPHGHAHMMAPGGLVHSHGGHMHSHGHSLQLKQGQRPSVRQILTGGPTVERTRTLPRNLGSTNANSSHSAGSLERKRVRYSELDFEKVMHTRKRHSELYHELNHSSKFHTIDRYSRDPAMSTFKAFDRTTLEFSSAVVNISLRESPPDTDMLTI
ncbi:hypothetical protein KUCAC02_011274, partial [Chaenocephalus aceratus]